MVKGLIRHDLMKKFGLKSTWDGKDRDEVINCHRELWKRWKKDHRYSSHFPVEKTSGFLESLEQLSLYGYSFTDISSMFGLSRERIRQYFEKHNLQTNEGRKAMYRVWDDERNCFFPISTEELEKILLENRRENKAQRKEEVKQRHIKAIQEFAKKHGCPPLIVELEKILRLQRKSTQTISSYWRGPRNNQVSYQEGIDNLYRAAGFAERPNRHNKL